MVAPLVLAATAVGVLGLGAVALRLRANALAKTTGASAATTASALPGTPAQKAAALADPVKLAQLVDALPASAVNPQVAATIAALQQKQGGVSTPGSGISGIANPQLEQALNAAMDSAQAAAAADPSPENIAAVIQAGANSAAFVAAEDSDDPSGGKGIPEGTINGEGPFGADISNAGRFKTALRLIQKKSRHH